MTALAAPRVFGDIIPARATFPAGAFHFRAGAVRLVALEPRPRTVALIGPGAPLPHLCALPGFAYVAYLDCRVAPIYPALARGWARFAQLAADVVDRSASHHSLRHRVTVTLEQIARDFGVDDAHGRIIPIPLPATLLAALAGSSRPRMCETLCALEEDGVIFRPHPRRVTVLTPERRGRRES